MGVASNKYGRRGSHMLQNISHGTWKKNERRKNDNDRTNRNGKFQGESHMKQQIHDRHNSFPPRSRYETGYRGNERVGARNRLVGCFNCGERNHQVATCRFDHKLRCGTCEQLGHKSKFCQYSNQNDNY